MQEARHKREHTESISIIKVQKQAKRNSSVRSQDSGYFWGSTCWHWEAGICLFIWALVSWVCENNSFFPYVHFYICILYVKKEVTEKE